MSQNNDTPNRGGLIAIVGSVAAAALFMLVPSQEGTIFKTYRDPVGVLTYCTGATEDAIFGKTYTPQECRERLDYDLSVHAAGISKCINMDKLTNGQRVAFVDFAYNEGISRFCHSSMARYANAGETIAGCVYLSQYNMAGGKVFGGLVKRREIERQYCTGERPL